MKNGFLRICSMILVIVLLVNMLPLQVLAQEPDTSRVEQNQIEQIKPEEDVSAERVVEEIPQKRTEFSKEFLLENGLHKVNVYPEAVHYATEKGWEEIDNTLIIKADGTITNTAGVWDVSFPQQLSKDKSISIQKDGHTLSFYMAGEITSNGSALMRSADTAKETLSVASVKQSAAAIQTPAVQDSVLHEEKILQKTQSRLTYANVYQNTNVIYDLKSNKVKESVVLEAYNSALRGYRYTLDVGTMIPVLEEDGQIVFYDANRENIVFVMPAPYMIDNGGAYNYDVQVQLTGSGSRYTMTYTLPQQWLAAEDRAWPVILDPVVQPSLSVENIRDRTVKSQGSCSQTWEMNACGRYEDGSYARTFLKYNSLPGLTSSDVIVRATVKMYLPEESVNESFIYAHKVLGTWDSGTISWSNKPNYDTTIEDYAIVQPEGWYSWEITDIVRGWYAGENTGVMFKTSDIIENGSVQHIKEFYSSDNGSNKPILSVEFRNHSGLEDYWDYTSASAGRAGTGYINNYTGNLVWVRQDMGFGGNRMPVSISHIYNASDSTSNEFGLGNGWRTNYNQMVYQWLGANQFPYYAWVDSDGTIHYFMTDENGEYKDEGDLGLTLTESGMGLDTVYEITDKGGNTSYFDSYGRLFKIENNQQTSSSIQITYLYDSQLIDTISDGVGRKYYFQYESDLLAAIHYMGYNVIDDEALEMIASTTYEYTGTNLTEICDNDGDRTNFEYGNKNLLTAAINSSGFALRYEYDTVAADRASRVYRTKETQDEDKTAGTLTFVYDHNQTTVTDQNGNALIYQFNNYGNTISIQDDEGRAQYYKYATEIAEAEDVTAKANQLRQNSKLQNTVVNRIKDSSFENETVWDTNASTPVVSVVSTESYFGNYSIQTTTTQAGTGIDENIYTLAPGETVTFSAYVKTGSAAAYLLIYYWTGSAASEQLSPNTNWTRLEATYTNNTSSSQNICPHILTATPGTFWADGVQLEYAATASRYNLLENGDFRYGSYGWNSSSGAEIKTLSGVAAPYLQNTVYQLEGSPVQQRRVSQTVPINGAAGDTFVLTGWAKGNAAPLEKEKEPYEIDYGEAREFAIQLQFDYINSNELSAPFIARFNPDSDQWQYSAVEAVAEDTFSSVYIELVYDDNVNTVWFDGIQLFNEGFGVNYTYYPDGNVHTVTDLQKHTTTYEYTNNDVTKIKENNEDIVNYEYDNYHNVIKAIAETGQVYTYDYDTYGNLRFTSTSVDGTYMFTYLKYTNDGNYLEFTEDALGNKTIYSYSTETGVLLSVRYPEDTSSTVTHYSYDDAYRVEQVTKSTDTSSEMSVWYYYEGDHISGMDRYYSDYRFVRGDFDLMEKITAGDYTLASYYYTDDGNYFLDTLEYGNYSMVQYSYDEKGKLIKEYHDDGTITYAYNNDGNLAIVTDSASGITTKYIYDMVGRVSKQQEKGTDYNHSIQYTYNETSNLASVHETINGVTHTDTFSYDAYDRVESVTNGTVNNQTLLTNEGASEHYNYDSFGRMYVSFTMDEESIMLSSTSEFSSPADGQTSGQIDSNRLQANGYDVTYSYTYDGNGNILSISDGTHTTSYVYDSANQLLRENNQKYGFTHTWTYDIFGNITSRKEYPYTTGALGTPTDTITYTYEEEYCWGDRLIGYDGQEIELDEIGNTIYDGTWDYLWRNGRELFFMTNYEKEWFFEYDVNGMRTERSDYEDITYQYVYNGNSLSQMTVGNNTLYFAYGANGAPISVDYNGTTYYYATNIQGDVIAILDDMGTVVVNYSYDAWGNHLSISGYMSNTLGTLNPLRYRGYVYDQETGLYYLQSRYYNPQWGRFLNADSFVSTGQGLLGNNMFAYCNNNPVMYVDPTGESLLGAIIVTGAIVGGLLGAFSAATTGGNVLESAIEGCLTGALSSTCGILISNPIVAVGIAIAGGAAIDFGMQVSTQYVTKKQITLSTIDYGRVAKTGLQTGISTAIPQYGKGAQNAVDAFGTALIWAEGSVLITCLDIAITNLAAASANQNTSISEKTNQRTSTNQYSVTFSGGRKLVM